MKTILYHFNVTIIGLEERNIEEIRTLKIKGLIKFLVPVNIHSFVFSPYKIKSHFLVPLTFSLNILGTKTIDGNFLQGLKVLIEIFIWTKNTDGKFYRD